MIVLPSELLKRWPLYTSLMTLEARMICCQCGNRLENSWEVVTRESKGAASLHEKGVGESTNE